MTAKTKYYGLEKLNEGEPFSSDGQQYTYADRDEIDRLLHVGAEAHHHTGAAAVNQNPTTAPTLALDTTQGSLPGGSQPTYAYTLVDPSGFETAPSPSVFVTLPGQSATPGSPTLQTSNAAGSLAAGQYSYVLSAYTGTTNTAETPASAPATAVLNASGEITLLFPSQPVGTSGWNIYRQKPGGSVFYYVTSVASSGATPISRWTDNGSLPDICSRLASTRNTTASTNQVTVTLPAAPPSGFTWRLYRTLTNDFTDSLLANILGGTTTYVDTGAGTTTGTPPANSQLIGGAPQINLASEVTGRLPAANIASFPLVVTFAFAGTLTPTTGSTVWVSPFSSATIVSAQASLGRGSHPASRSVIVDILKASGTAPASYASICSGATPSYPEVPVGSQIGAKATPVTTAVALGDSLSVDILQAGGGATPTDHDLTVSVLLFVTP